jgi:hypothetical protein
VYGQSIAQLLQNTISTQQFKYILSEFFIPHSLGKITNSNFSASDTIVINIQDLHLHPNVQKNIASIIELFDKKYGIKNVYMEGAFGDVDTSWLCNFKDKKNKQKIINNILNTGMLTGPEYYSVISNNPHLIKGLENKSPYLQNLQLFGNILYSQNEISSILSSIDKDIEYLKSFYSNKRQLKVQSLFKNYRSGKISPKKFYALISNYAQKFGIDIQPIFNKQSGSIEIDNTFYKNISIYIALLKQSDKINYSQASKQLQSLILNLKKILPYQAFKMITDQSSNFKDIDKLYAFIIKFSKDLNIDLSINFPELNKLFNQVELNKNINPITMLDEEERLEDQLISALATDQGSRDVSFLSWFADEFYNYFSTSITSDNYDWYKQHINEWKRLYIKYIDNKKLSILEPYEKLIDAFYNVNIDRNQYFFDNLSFLHDSHKLDISFDSTLSNTEKVIKSLEHSKNIFIVVTGGFHTQYLNDMLAKQGISFIVITPTVDSGVDLAKQAYHSLAKEQSKLLFSSLATLNMSQTDINQRLIGLSDVLVQRQYSTQEINELLQPIAQELRSEIKLELVGDINKTETLKLIINDKIFAYDNIGRIFIEQTNQESTSTQTSQEKSSRSAGITAFVNFILSVFSIPFLILIPMMSWALPFMIIPLLIFIPSSVVSSYEFWQRQTILNAQLNKSAITSSQISQQLEPIYIKEKLLTALPQNISDMVRGIIELKDDMAFGVVMYYDQQDDKIYINLSLVKQLFFENLGKNIKNKSLLTSFIKHELAHRQFANSENKIRFFIHNNFKWLEELLVSFSDAFRAMITTSISTPSSTQPEKPPSSEQVQVKPEEKPTAAAAQEKHERQFDQEKYEVKLQNEKVRLLAYYGVANVDFARIIGISGSDAEITSILEDSQKTRFVRDIPKVSQIFKNDISKEDLITELLKTNYPHAVIAALALEEINLTDKKFQEILEQVKNARNDRSAFFNLQRQLTADIESGLIDRISQGEDVKSLLALPFPSFNVLQLKNMLRQGIINSQDIKNLASSFREENFFEELRNIVSQKMIASQKAEISQVLSQEDIDKADNTIQFYIKEMLINENPINIAKTVYASMVVFKLGRDIQSEKVQLTKENLERIFNTYFSDIIAKEKINSFFAGNADSYEAIMRAIDYLSTIESASIKFATISLSELMLIVFNSSNELKQIDKNSLKFLQSRKNVLNAAIRAIDGFSQSYYDQSQWKEFTLNRKINLLQEVISLNQKEILLTNNQQELANQVAALNTYYNDVLKEIYSELTGNTANTLNDVLIKQVSSDLEFKLSMSAIDIIMARNDISKITDAKDDYNSLNVKLQSTENFLQYLINLSTFSNLSKEQLDEVNQKIRVLSNDSIALRAQIVVHSSNGAVEVEKLFSSTKGPIQDFIKALSIKDSLDIDITNPVYIAIENFNENLTTNNLHALVDSFKTIVSSNNQSKFKEITDNISYTSISIEFIKMLSFVTNDLVESANGDITKLKLAVLIGTMFSNHNVGSSVYINTIYDLIESLNVLTNAMSQTDSNRIVLEKKLQELFVMSFSVSSINIAVGNTTKIDPKQFLSILEKEKKILQSFKDKKVISDDEILKIVRRKEMLMKNFITPVINFTSKAIQEQTYKFHIYQALISTYNDLIANMSSRDLLAKLSLQNEIRRDDIDKEKIRKILSKLIAFQEISNEEITYLESIKNTNLYPKVELISAIKLNLQVDAQIPVDFVSKVLNKADLNELFNEFNSYKNRLIKNRPLFDKANKDFKYAFARLDKILASLCPVAELGSVFGNNSKYFFVTKYSNDKNTLMQIVQREDVSIQCRLYAYGYLKAMDINDLDSYVQTQGFLDKVKGMLEAKNLQIGNNYFDLRACEIGINIVTSNEVLNKLISINDTKLAAFKSYTLVTYRTIMESNFVLSEFGNTENALSDLTFTFADNKKKDGLDLHDRMYRRIAHELGHRQLYAIGVFSREDAKSSSMFHEFFADIVAGTFMSKFLGRTVEYIIAKNSSIRQPYVAFSTYRMAESAADEGHNAARGLINSIKKAIDLAGKTMNYETILEVSIKIADQVQSEGLFVAQQEENLAKKIITTIATATADITTKDEEKGEFLYQFIKGEDAKFKTLQEEQEVFGTDEQGQKSLYYYLVAKHKHESKPRLFGRRLYTAEVKFIENYRIDHIIPVANVSNTPTFQQTWQPVLVPSLENFINSQALSENEAKATESTKRYYALWWIGIVLAHLTVLPAVIYWLARLFSYPLRDTKIQPIEPVYTISQSQIIGNTAEQTESQEITQEETQEVTQKTIPIDDSKKVEAFVNLVRALPFEMQYNFARVVLANNTLTSRFIRIISTDDEEKWNRELSSEETNIKDITDAIKDSFSSTQETMETTKDGRIKLSFKEIQKGLATERSGIISLTVQSMSALDHVSYIEAKNFEGFKNRLKTFIHNKLRFLENTQIFIARLWRSVSLRITTSKRARKFSLEWAGISITWIPPYGIDLPDTLQDAHIDDEGKLIEPFVLYGKQRFAGNRRGTITRIVRATYKDGKQAYLKNFKPGQKLSEDIAAVEISYNFESETCAIHFDMGNIDDGFDSTHPLIKGIRNHDVGNGYHVDGLGTTLPTRRDHKLLGCRYVTMSGKIITISRDGLENGFDIAGEELSGDLSIQLIWEPIVHVVDVEFYDRGDRQELKRGRQQIKVIAGHDARIKGFAPGAINATANWFRRFFTGLTGAKTGVATHAITWAKLPTGLSWLDNYNTFGLTEDFESNIEEGVILETPPMRVGHIMLPNGRIGTVRCKVIDADSNQEITDFQMGKTPVDRNLRIEYEFTPDKAEYSLNFEANGGTLEEQPNNIEVNSNGEAVIPANTALPTRKGYIFKGYQIVKCSHISLFNLSITDEYQYMTIRPEQLQSGTTLGGIVSDLVLVAQWEKEEAPATQEQAIVQQEQTQATQPNLFLKALKFVFVNIIFWKILVPFVRTVVNAATGKYGRFLQIVAIASIAGAIIWLVNRLIMHPTRTILKIAKTIIKIYIIFAGFGYLNKLEKILFITSLGIVFFITSVLPVLTTFSILALTGLTSIVVSLLFLIAVGCIVYSEFKMKANWWNWAKRTFGKAFKFIFLASGKTFRKGVQVAKIAASEPIKYAINLYDNMTNIADNLAEIPAREGYEFVGLKIVGTDSEDHSIERTFTLEDMQSDFVVPHQFFEGTNTIQFEYVWLSEMKASFLTGTNMEVQNVPQEIKKGVLRGKKFEFPGFRQEGVLNALWDPRKYILPTRTGYEFDGLVIRIDGQTEQVIGKEIAMSGFEISEDRMTGPISFEIKWKAQEGTLEEKEGTAQPEAQASQQQEPQVEQAEESAQPKLEQREEEIGEVTLPKEIETFAKLVRELPFEIQYRFVVAVFGIDNMPLVANFISSISTPTDAWRRNLFKQQMDREKILEIFAQRSNALQPMVATDDGRIILNFNKIKNLLGKSNRQGIRSLIVQATSELSKLPYMEAAKAITEAQTAAKNAKETARIAEETAKRTDYEAKTATTDQAVKAQEAQKAAKTAEKAKAEAEAAARIAKETAKSITTSTKIRAFIHNNLRFLERFIIFISSVFVRMTLTIRTSTISRKFTTEWGDVSVIWIPPEGLELEDSTATARIDEDGRLIEPVVIYGKQRLAGNRRGTVQRIVRITDRDGNLKYLDNFQTGDTLPEGTKAVEVFYNFIPDTCKIRIDMGAIDAQARFESSPLVKGIGDHEVGMGYHVDGFGDNLPERNGYKLLGCRYTTMNGQIVYIPLKLLKKGFDITGPELSGDLTIQLIWEPNVNDVKIQFFDGEVKQALEGNIKVVQGHGARIKGLAPNTLAAFANWIRRLGTGIAARQSGVKTHKISWARLPSGLDWPDNYQTDGLNEDFISNIEDEVILEEPPMRTGRIMLVDGRVATVACEVKNASTGEILRNFQFGRTPVKGNLRIEYRIIEEEKYSLHFEANGATLDSQSIVNYDIKKKIANVQPSNIPTKNGYIFKGYKAIKYTLGNDRYETKDINPAEVRSGFIIENVFGDIVLVAQWEKEQTLVTRQQQSVSKGAISQALTVAWAIAKGAWGHLSARQKIIFVFAGIILLATGTIIFLLTYGIIAIGFAYFILLGLHAIEFIALLIIGRLIYVMIKGFLVNMLKAIGNFLIKSFKLIVLASGKTFRRSYRVTRQVFRAPINYAKNFYENMTNIADNLSAIPTREGYEFGGFSVTNDNTRETAKFSLEEIKRDFIVQGKYFSQNEAGESIVKLKYIWLPKVTITTGAGTNTKGKQKSLELSSREINLVDYKDSFIPPEGYDYTNLYWTCDAYPDQAFVATAIVNVDKPCVFTPHWKLLPKATMSIGNGTWKNAHGDDAINQRPVTVTATRQGAMANLREARDALEAPDDCDPDSLYFTEAGRDEPIEENEAGEVLIKSDTLYTPHWKTLAESNKVKLKIGEGESIILTADENGFIDLEAVVRDRGLKPPQDFTEKVYWTANGKKDTKLRGKIDIRHTSVLTLHWEAFDRNAQDYSKAEEMMFGQEGAEELAQLEIFPKYPIEFYSGVESGSIDDVTPNLAPDLQTLLKSTKLSQGEKFYFSFKKNTPTRAGYRFKGVLVETDGYRNEFFGTKKFTIPGEYITGPIKITLLWEKEYPVTSDNVELSTALGDLKAYENNDFHFKGFGAGLLGIGAGFPIPTKTGFKFRGVRVQVSSRQEEHLGTGAFTISKQYITGPIKITVLWDEECTVTCEDVTISTVFKDLKIYKNNDFYFKGFNKSNTPTKDGYRFRGVKIKIGRYEKTFGTGTFTITGKDITGPITITSLWEKEYPVTSEDVELSTVLGDLKAYENNDFHFKGFGAGLLGIGAGFPIPTKTGFKFRGVRVQVSGRQEEHLGTEAFTISKQYITEPIKMTVLWDKEFSVTSDDPELSTVLGELKAYKNNDFYFKGFGSGVFTNGYPIPTKSGFRFKGIRIKIGDKEEEHLGLNDFTIPAKDITGPITITSLWEKEYPVTSEDVELSTVLGDLKGYEGNDLKFPGFVGTDHPIPTKTGFRFKGVRVQVSTFDQTFGTEPFTISKQYITEPIKITAVWEAHSHITFNKNNAEEMSEVPEGEFYYEGDTFHFKGFNTKFLHMNGYRLPKKTGYKFLGVSVKNGNTEPEDHLSNAAFDITVQGPISITYLWEEHSSITVDTDNGGIAPDVVPANKFYFKDDMFHFNGFKTSPLHLSGYTEPTKKGFKFIGVRVQNGDDTKIYSREQAYAGFDTTVKGNISITYLWEEHSPITVDFGNGEATQILSDIKFKGDTYKFPGVGKGYLSNGLELPERRGYKFLGVSVKNSNTEPEDHLSNAAFDITVQGPISITYLWEQEATQKKGWSLWKSEESAQEAAQAAAEIGMLLGTQVAGNMFGVNGSLKLIKSTMDSFATFERVQSEKIREAQTLVSQNSYFKEKANEEILRQLLRDSELLPQDISIFLKLLSEVDIEMSGEVMLYKPNTQEPSNPGKIHVNYKMLRAMFLDANGNTQNIELFKVFIKHELTHMEFSISDNPLYKAAHNIPFLEEFLVSLSDLYVWQQEQLILPEYTDIIKFIFTNARTLSIAAGISIKEAERISKLYTGLPQREMTIELLKTAEEELGNISTSTLKPLILFVANSSDGRLIPASSYADNVGGISSDYATAVVEHIPSNILVPTRDSRRMSVNVSFNDLVYDVYVRNIEGKCFIGLKLKSGATLEQNADISAKNFAAAAQFFANDLNTNSILREEFNRVTNIGISQEGVAMMDFLGFPNKITEQEDVQKLYEPEGIDSGLVGVYSIENLAITSENLTTIEQNIKASRLFKLNNPEKFYEVDITYARLSNTNSINKIVNIKKKEGATTIILNIKDFNLDTLLSESTKELLVEAISIIHSMDLTCTIQLDITKATEEMFKQLLELGFDGISIDAQNQDVKDISFIKKLLDSLITVSMNNSIREKNTIHLKNKAVRDLLGDLSNSNILTITNIDPETYEASIDETGALSAMEIGYEIGHRVLEQNIKISAENMRVLLNIFNNTHTNITVNEIREAVIKAGLNPILQKHMELLLNSVANNETGINYKVAQAIGFVRGLVESYAIEMYLEAFNITFEAFNENNVNDKIALRTLLTGLFIIDKNNTFFKDSTTLKTFFEQAEIILDNASIDGTLSDISKQITLFVNSVILRFEKEKDISDLLLIQSSPSQKLYISLAILNDLINKLSFRKIVDETAKRTNSSALAVKNILGAA